MMLSVLKNTKTPVKFWFLKNYLSPTFKVRVLKTKLQLFPQWGGIHPHRSSEKIKQGEACSRAESVCSSFMNQSWKSQMEQNGWVIFSVWNLNWHSVNFQISILASCLEIQMFLFRERFMYFIGKWLFPTCNKNLLMGRSGSHDGEALFKQTDRVVLMWGRRHAIGVLLTTVKDQTEVPQQKHDQHCGDYDPLLPSSGGKK